MPTKASDNPYPSILVTEGTEPSAPAAGKQRLYIDSTTHLLKRTDSSGVDVTIEGGGSAWTLLLNKDGSTTTGFVSASGTWASNGTIISQTNTASNPALLRWDTIVPQAGPTIYQVDVRFPSSGQSAGAGGTGAGLSILHQSGATTDFMIFQMTHDGTNSKTVGSDRAGVAGLRYVTLSASPIGAAIAFDTWATLRVVIGAYGFASYYVNGTHIGNMGFIGGTNAATSQTAPDYVAAYCYTAKADFRNIKVWGLTLP